MQELGISLTRTTRNNHTKQLQVSLIVMLDEAEREEAKEKAHDLEDLEQRQTR